jgi:hypothetical protein
MKYVVKFFAVALVATTIHSMHAIFTNPTQTSTEVDVDNFCSKQCKRVVPFDTYGGHTVKGKQAFINCEKACYTKLWSVLNELNKQAAATQKAENA